MDLILKHDIYTVATRDLWGVENRMDLLGEEPESLWEAP